MESAVQPVNPFRGYDYEPYPWQLRIHRSPAKTKWIQAGRRSGKTRSALQEDLDTIDIISRRFIHDIRSDRYLTAEEAGLVPAVHCWTVAPTKAQMYQVWNEMQAFIPGHLVARTNPYRDDYRPNGGRGSGFKEDDLHVWLVLVDEDGEWLTTTTDAKKVPRPRPIVFWELKSADNPESLQSTGLDFLHITEAQDVKEAAWLKLRPTLMSPGRAGKALIEGIPPMSSSHWFARGFRRAMDDTLAKKNWRLHSAFHASYLDNPLLTADQRAEIELDRQSMLIEDWERLYMAVQPQGFGQFFRNVRDAAGRDGTYQLSNPRDGRYYVAGLDIGRSNDATVLVVKDRQSRASVHAVEMERRDWGTQLETIRYEIERWGVERVVMDSTGLGGQIAHDTLVDELVEAGVPVEAFNFTPRAKYHDLFQPYAMALERGTVSFPPEWTKLIQQLEDCGHRETNMRGHQFFMLAQKHDDWIDAEALALYACDPAQMNDEQRGPRVKAVPGVAGINSSRRVLRRLQPGWREALAVAEPDEEVPDMLVNGEPVRV